MTRGSAVDVGVDCAHSYGRADDKFSEIWIDAELETVETANWVPKLILMSRYQESACHPQ